MLKRFWKWGNQQGGKEVLTCPVDKKAAHTGRGILEPKLSTHLWPTGKRYADAWTIQDGMEDRKRRGQLEARMSEHRSACYPLKSLLAKPARLASGNLDFRWLLPPYVRMNSGSLCLNCTNPGICSAPTFLLRVWDFKLAQAEGAYVTSPQWKLCVTEYWAFLGDNLRLLPGRVWQDALRNGLTSFLKSRWVSNYLNRKRWVKVLLESYGTLPFSSSDWCQNSEFMRWCPWSALQIPRNINVAIKLLLIWK